MNNDETSVIDLIKQRLSDLNWNWHTPRLQDWAKRVAQSKGDPIYKSIGNLPQDAAIALATYLDLYYKCDNLLRLELGSNWNHALCREVANKYKCTQADKMPLAAYKELLQELQAAFTYEDIPF